MKIAIIAATGKQGKALLTEALSRGNEVTAIVRDKTKLNNDAVHVIEKDILSLTYEDIKEFDVIIDAFGAWTEDTLPLHKVTTEHLLEILKGQTNRLLFVGGAGSLFADDSKTVLRMDSKDFPSEYYPVAKNMKDAFDVIKQNKDVNWTYLSPANFFDAEGKRTGNYKIGENVLLKNAKGESYVSYADYAVAMIDEAEKGKHIQKRFTVVTE